MIKPGSVTKKTASNGHDLPSSPVRDTVAKLRSPTKKTSSDDDGARKAVASTVLQQAPIQLPIPEVKPTQTSKETKGDGVIITNPKHALLSLLDGVLSRAANMHVELNSLNGELESLRALASSLSA